ncbi:hypothetical protein [Streptomyces sp. SID5643]|nr:hypothetical protein [Streptomyces sp. SID5643]
MQATRAEQPVAVLMVSADPAVAWVGGGHPLDSRSGPGLSAVSL